jgi:hypothetical protein
MICVIDIYDVLQTVVDVVPATAVTKPFPFPQIEFGAGFLLAVILEAPGIMTQS